MKQFPLIFRHFLIRSFLDPITIIFLIILPLGIVILTSVINIAAGAQDIPMQVTAIATLFMISFQFASGDVLSYSIYDDIRGPVRWRLLATPVPPGTFFTGAFAASWVFNIVQGILIVGATALLFDTRWGNMFVFAVVLLLVSVISQLMALTIAHFAPTRKMASGIITAIVLFMMFSSGALFVPLGDSAFAVFLQSYGTPLALAWRAILFSGLAEDNMSQAMFNIGILGVIAAVLAGLVLILGRRKKAL